MFKGERGTLSLEGIIVIPVFLALWIFLITLIKIAIIYVMLNQISYNVMTKVTTFTFFVDRGYEYVAEQKSDIESLRQLISVAVDHFGDEEDSALFGEIGSGTSEMLIEQFIEGQVNNMDSVPFFNKDKLTFLAKTEGAFKKKYEAEITYSYAVDIPIPFTRVERNIVVNSYERLFTGHW